MAWRVLLMIAFAVVWVGALPAWGTWEEWVQDDGYRDVGVVESDELRVVVRQYSSLQLLQGEEVLLELPFPVESAAYSSGVDTNGYRIIANGVVDSTISKVVVTDMRGNLIAERTWNRGDPGAFDVAIWGSYAIVAHSNVVAAYDLETLEFVARLLEGSFADGFISLVDLGSGNNRLLIGEIEESANTADYNKYLTVHEIGPSLEISNRIGPLAILGPFPLRVAPAPERGFYLAHGRFDDPHELAWISQFDSGGNLIESVGGLSSYGWGDIDIDGCYNVIGVTAGAHSYAPGIYWGVKWVPDSRDPGCFIDVLGRLFESDVAWLGRQGITKGCNPPLQDRFCSDDLVTRGQMAAFLHRALADVLTPTQQTEFGDGDANIFAADIEWLGGTGVTKGCNPPNNDRYCPDDLVTRGQMAALLVRALGYTDDGGGDRFVDDDGNTFEADIDKLGTAGVAKGCNPPANDRFCPDDFVTRGEMAAFLHRALSS